VLWAAAGADNYGVQQVSAAVELSVRWDQTATHAVNAQGATEGYDATVIVDREIAVGSIMALGTIESIGDTPTDLKVVKRLQKTPDLKGRKFHYVASLQNYNDSLPTIV
jgi:hypothetical protein